MDSYKHNYYTAMALLSKPRLWKQSARHRGNGDSRRGFKVHILSLTYGAVFTIGVRLYATATEKGSARNGKLEVPVSFLKAKQGYTARKTERDKWNEWKDKWI
jgi:hypothetical protein